MVSAQLCLPLLSQFLIVPDKCDTSELSSSIVDSYDSCSEESDEDEDVDFEYDSSSDEDVPLDSEVEFAKTLHVT